MPSSVRTNKKMPAGLGPWALPGLLSLMLFAMALYPAPGHCQGSTVAVFPLKNNGQAQYGGLSSGLAMMLVTNLTKAAKIEVVDPANVTGALDKVKLAGGAPALDDALKAAARLDADYAVTGEFVVFGGRFRIDVRVYDVGTGAVKAAEKGQAKEDALFEMVDDLSERLASAITGGLPLSGGAVLVSSEPAGAAVAVDGNKSGSTPATVKGLAAGPHEVRVEMEGYRPHVETVTVAEKETAKVSVKLVRLFGGVRVWWKGYPSSDVSLAGEVIRSSQFIGNMFARFCRNVPSGNYTVTVVLPYKEEASWNSRPVWRTYSSEVVISPGVVTNIFINNDRFSPGIEVSTCSSCSDNWNFDTTISWYEDQ